jgi:dihydroflavonol-4-reductase
MLRRTSSTKGIDDLDVERCYGDVFDDDALRTAMAGPAARAGRDP